MCYWGAESYLVSAVSVFVQGQLKVDIFSSRFLPGSVKLQCRNIIVFEGTGLDKEQER